MTNAAGRFKSWVLELIESVETQPWGPGTILALLVAIIAVRNLLEIAVAKNPVFVGLAAFVHYPLAYVGPFLGLTLVLSFWGRVAPARVARLMSVAWFLTLLPPVADLALHPAAEKPPIAYLQADPSELGLVWLRFFDPTIALVGTTLGIRLETLAAVLLGAVYVGAKSRRWWRALGAASSVYIVSLFFFSLPILVTRFFRFFSARITLNDILRGESVLIRIDRDAAPDSAAILWLAPVLALLAIVWRWAEQRRPEEAFFGHPMGGRRLPGTALFFVGALYAGMVAAIFLHLPATQPLVWAPYDFLALLAAPLALGLLCTAARRLAPGDGSSAAWLGGFALLICTALGRSASAGILAAAAVLLPSGLDLVPPRARSSFLAVALPFGASGAFVAGYGLVIGPEGIARMPLAVAAPTVLPALGFGVLQGAPRLRPAWAPVPVLGVSMGLGAFLAGDVRLVVVAVPAGLLAGLVSWLWGRDRPAGQLLRMMGLTLALVVFGMTRGMVASELLRGPWAQQAGCVPRLDVIDGQRFEEKGDWAAAENLYRKALRCDAKYVPAMRALGLGLIHHRADRVEQGLAQLTKAAELAPDSAADLNNLAGAYLQVKRPADAVPILERARALEPQNLAVQFNWAQALEDLHRLPEATRAWQEYIDRAAGRPEEAEGRKLARQHLRAIQGAMNSPSSTPGKNPEPR